MLDPGTRWIMRLSRLAHCSDEERTAEFVNTFASWGLTASPSRLSRWEYGNSHATWRLLRAYESGCALPPFLLFALNDRRQRAATGAHSELPSIELTELLTAEDSYEVLDRALTDAEVTGSDWYRLASYAASHGYFYLSRHNTQIVARRLIEELARSLGPAYILRFEAFRLLAGHSRMQKALIGQLIGMFDDQSTGHLGDAVSLILRAEPLESTELIAALWAVDSPMAREGRAWFSDLLSNRTPRPSTAAERSQVAVLADLLHRELPKWATVHIEREMAGPLLCEALGGDSPVKRHEASVLLMLAGVQETLGGGLLDAFDREPDPNLRARLSGLHGYLVPSTQAKRLESLALAESDPGTRHSLWYARGHAVDPIAVSEELLAALADPHTQFVVSYALGMTGSVDAELFDRREHSAEQRAVIRWWQQRGPALLT